MNQTNPYTIQNETDKMLASLIATVNTPMAINPRYNGVILAQINAINEMVNDINMSNDFIIDGLEKKIRVLEEHSTNCEELEDNYREAIKEIGKLNLDIIEYEEQIVRLKGRCSALRSLSNSTSRGYDLNDIDCDRPMTLNDAFGDMFREYNKKDNK